MNFKQKLGYMFIGCLFTIVGYILASLGGGDTTHAQKDEQVLDEIVCRKLKIVNAAGKEVALIGATKDGGIMNVSNAAGKEVMSIGADKEGGGIAVRNAAGKGVITIVATEDGGGIAVRNTAGKEVAGIGATEDGGFIAVLNAAGKGVARIVATEDGSGGYNRLQHSRKGSCQHHYNI